MKTHDVTVTACIPEREGREETSFGCLLPQAECSEKQKLQCLVRPKKPKRCGETGYCSTIKAEGFPLDRILPQFSVNQTRLKLTDKHALADLSPPDDGGPKTTHIAHNAVSDYVNASLIPSTPPSLLIKYVTVKPDRWSYPTLCIAAQDPTRRLCGAIPAGHLGFQCASYRYSGERVHAPATAPHGNLNIACLELLPDS
ncbi:unnamed protein product [Taenia asiatica]|uniref:Uncharacterized protein n=1 Tax=Taenia asiatica TaxID=60517 RepID=A0A0R3WEX0_TAEAS|nr:unnamed protein product [Taenia asiatica]